MGTIRMVITDKDGETIEVFANANKKAAILIGSRSVIKESRVIELEREELVAFAAECQRVIDELPY